MRRLFFSLLLVLVPCALDSVSAVPLCDDYYRNLLCDDRDADCCPHRRRDCYQDYAEECVPVKCVPVRRAARRECLPADCYDYQRRDPCQDYYRRCERDVLCRDVVPDIEKVVRGLRNKKDLEKLATVIKNLIEAEENKTPEKKDEPPKQEEPPVKESPIKTPPVEGDKKKSGQ